MEHGPNITSVTPKEKSTSVLALIPARTGSKGLKLKNTRPIRGKPLFMYSVDEARNAGIKRICISTDIDEILCAKLPQNVEVFSRPAALAGDHCRMDSVLINFLETNSITKTTILLLQPTSPLRKAEDISAALDLYFSRDFNMVLSVCPTSSTVLKSGLLADGRFQSLSRTDYLFENRQFLPQVFRPNGAIYIFDADTFLKHGGFPTDNLGGYVMSEMNSIDIDTIEDLERVELLMGQGG